MGVFGRRRRVGSVGVVIAVAVLGVLPTPAKAVEGSRFRLAATGANWGVATDSPYAAEHAAAVLEAGGNAVDAAVTAVFTIGVARPEACGIGGGGFLLYRGADGRTAALDFREKAPSSVDYRFSDGIGVPGTPAYTWGTGHNVVGVPGVVAGLHEALAKLGTIGLDKAVGPAAALARSGFVVSQSLAGTLGWRHIDIRLFPATALAYLKNGLEPYKAGEIMKLPDYANSLELIGRDGPDAFYRGPISRAIVSEMQKPSPYPQDRSAMTAADLDSYRPVWRTPLTGKYRKHQIVAMPPPTAGGIATIEMLNILEGFDLAGKGASSADHLHLYAEAQKIAWADRVRYVGDPDVVDVPTAELTAQSYASQRRKEIEIDKAKEYSAGEFGRPRQSAREGDAGTHTTNVSVIDAAGNAVAITCTIEQPLGSAVVAPGTGFLLNNELNDFSEPGTANEPAPGKRPRSAMSPTIVAKDGRAMLATGGAGGPTIIGGVAQMIVNSVDFGMDVAHAIDAERIDARGFGAKRLPDGSLEPFVNVEDTRIDRKDPTVLPELERRGHRLNRAGEYGGRSNPYGVVPVGLPVMTAVAIDPTGARSAVSDPRGDAFLPGSPGRWGSVAG